MFDSFEDVERELARGRSKDRRKVGNNTYLERRDAEHIALKLHATDIVTFDAEGMELNTGGWYTVTTKSRLNDYVPGRIYSEQGVWYWRLGFHDDAPPPVRFWDGMRIGYTWDLLNPQDAPQDADAERKATERAIRDYVKLVRDALPLGDPSDADCWHCLMVADDGRTMGDISDSDHLTSHMAEGYVVPSLVLNAMRERNYGNLAFVWRMRMDRPDKYARDSVARDVRRYLRRRLVTSN